MTNLIHTFFILQYVYYIPLHASSIILYYTDAESVIVTMKISDDTRCCISTIHPPDDEHIMLETCGGLRPPHTLRFDLRLACAVSKRKDKMEYDDGHRRSYLLPFSSQLWVIRASICCRGSLI